ncbi:MAG: hypothetical protein R2748_28420 [Bryobacterales bacterium]
MPTTPGTILTLRGFYDEKVRRHKLVAEPESLQICKRKTRVLALVAKNETAGTEHYKPLVLGYRINGGDVPANSGEPKHVFEDSPNAGGRSFIPVDGGKPTYFMLKEHLGLEPRENACSFPDAKPGKHAVIVQLSHEGWDDAEGSGYHADWHIES